MNQSSAPDLPSIQIIAVDPIFSPNFNPFSVFPLLGSFLKYPVSSLCWKTARLSPAPSAVMDTLGDARPCTQIFQAIPLNTSHWLSSCGPACFVVWQRRVLVGLGHRGPALCCIRSYAIGKDKKVLCWPYVLHSFPWVYKEILSFPTHHLRW